MHFCYQTPEIIKNVLKDIQGREKNDNFAVSRAGITNEMNGFFN